MTFEGVGASPLATLVRAKTYANPVINFSLPDPTIIKGDDEYYYLYATESIKNVPIHRSRDLVNWYYVGTAFTDATRPNFEPKGRIWAPDINKIGDKYVMYYSMSTWGGEWTCGIGIATADSRKDHLLIWVSYSGAMKSIYRIALILFILKIMERNTFFGGASTEYMVRN